MTHTIDILLDAILPHVAFDGWSETAFHAAVDEAGLSAAEAKAIAPRGALDLAAAYHRRGDQAMVARMRETDLSGLRYRDRVATALRFRIEALDDREAVRRATSLFALPLHAAEGARLIWETADHVWTALGDTSEDVNWYTKRATLAGVWASTVLFWLGDESADHTDTLDFIDRRIEDVMRIEKVKGQFRENPLTKPFSQMAGQVLSRIRKPGGSKDLLPGRWSEPS